ncbi:uncharacterized protein LOC144550635 [Carex rostrata]
MSIFGGSLECTKLLIKAGADVNLYCPLATAIVFNSAETVKCLLEGGADPNIPSEVILNDYGMLPIEVAAERGEKGFVEMLLPFTSQLPTVPNWNVEGIINYVKCPAFKKKHEIRRKERFADLKVKGEQAFRRSGYLAAIIFYTGAIEIAPTDTALFGNRSIDLTRVEREGFERERAAEPTSRQSQRDGANGGEGEQRSRRGYGANEMEPTEEKETKDHGGGGGGVTEEEEEECNGHGGRVLVGKKEVAVEA